MTIHYIAAANMSNVIQLSIFKTYKKTINTYLNKIKHNFRVSCSIFQYEGTMRIFFTLPFPWQNYLLNGNNISKASKLTTISYAKSIHKYLDLWNVCCKLNISSTGRYCLNLTITWNNGARLLGPKKTLSLYFLNIWSF